MCKRDKDLPDNLAQEFFKLRKEDIINDLREQRKEKEKKKLESQNPTQSTSANNRPDNEQVDATLSVPPSDQDSYNPQDPSSNPKINNESEYNEEDVEELDHSLPFL
jgi:hypothetical protein